MLPCHSSLCGEIVYWDGNDLLRRFKSEHLRVEVQLGMQRGLDALSLAKTMLLALEANVGDGNALVRLTASTIASA